MGNHRTAGFFFFLPFREDNSVIFHKVTICVLQTELAQNFFFQHLKTRQSKYNYPINPVFIYENLSVAIHLNFGGLIVLEIVPYNHKRKRILSHSLLLSAKLNYNMTTFILK